MVIVRDILCFGWTCVFDRLPRRQGAASYRFQNLYLGRYCVSGVGHLRILDRRGTQTQEHYLVVMVVLSSPASSIRVPTNLSSIPAG
jgi:hypothetical protein